MNMILYKSIHCPFLPHYPLSNHAVVTRTMKISRIYLLLFDTCNLLWFLCSGWQVVDLCDSHKSTHASKGTSELKGCGTLSRVARGTFEKLLTSPFFNLNSSAFVVSPKFSLFLEFLGTWGLNLQQGFSFERKVCSLSESRCEYVSEEILISH